MTPKKLKHDAIVEAIYDVRFAHDGIPEVALGGLLGAPMWGDFAKEALPIDNVPAPVRRADAHMRYEPLYVFRDRRSPLMARIGEQSVSLHVLYPYVGWTKWSPTIRSLNRLLVDTIQGLTVTRLGLRYIDALRADVHKVQSVTQLAVESSWKGNRIENDILVQFRHSACEGVDAIIRIASGSSVVGQLPSQTSCVTDIDVHSTAALARPESAMLDEWAERAHEINKEIFFGLLPPEQLADLVEE